MKRFLLACAAVALLGCGGDSTGPAASVEGTWNLQTVNGDPVPATVIIISSQSYRLEVLSDQYVLHGDGTYDEFSTVRETQGSTVTTSDESDTGTWSQSGSQVSITASDATTASGTISGNKITVNNSGFVLVYQKA